MGNNLPYLQVPIKIFTENKENADTDSAKLVYMTIKTYFFITAYGSQPG